MTYPKKTTSLQLKSYFMKKLILSAFSFLFCLCLHAQKKDLIARSSDKGMYLEHVVVAKETYFSVGRLYNLHPKSIASYNGLDLNKGLNIDQKIRIPLLDTNFTQKGNTGTPVYYRVGEKEGLMTVSKKNNNVLLASLREWNNLSGDELKKDAKIIVGFLKSNVIPAVTIATTPKKEEPVVKKEEPSVKKEETDVKKEEKPVTPVSEDITKKEEEKIAEAEKKSEKKEEKKEPVVVKDTRVPEVEGAGYFKDHFDRQIKTLPTSKNETVTSGIFKTMSGWQDGKYYLLIDKVPPGTIIRISNPTNNKVVYAKVLGEMSGIRQNEGYNIRISNAAAAALSVTEPDKFIVKVSY